MSTQSFPLHSTPPKQSSASTPADRRRQWLITRGFLSPNGRPARRLANLLPRRQSSSPASVHKSPQNHHSFADIRLEVRQNAVPVVVTNLPKSHPDEQHQPSATRTVSMPTEDSSRLRPAPFRSRPSHRRIVNQHPHQDPSPKSRSKRFLMRLKRRSRDLSTPDARMRSSVDIPQSHAREADRMSMGRRSLDRRRESLNINSTNNARARAIYTVIDRELPRHILQGNARFQTSDWQEYRDHIDELAEDPKFMEYLTAPVQRSLPPLQTDSPTKGSENQSQHLAVNKLYPLAFIRLLEAHAKGASEGSQPCDPTEEEHRYDDVDRDDEARVERTVSNGIYDMGRFRTVGGETLGLGSDQDSNTASPVQIPKLLDTRAQSRVRPQRGLLFSRMSRDRRAASVPVC